MEERMPQKESGKQQKSKFNLRNVFQHKTITTALRKKQSYSDDVSRNQMPKDTIISDEDGRIVLSGEHIPGHFVPYRGKPCSRQSDISFKTSQLCQKCKDVCETLRRRDLLTYQIGGFTYVKTGATKQYYKLQHHTYINLLQTSSRTGCHLCSLLLPTSIDPVCRPVESEYSLYLFRTTRDQETRFTLSVGRRISECDPGAYYWPINLDLKSSAVAPSVSRSTILSTASNSCRQWVQTVLDECRSTHQSCRRESTTSLLPKRLICVDDSKELAILRLIEPLRDDAMPSQYVALSYCWGSSPSFRLTSATVRTLHDGVPSDELPKTYQDAVLICRWLDIKYLWIDALCIIQDSDEDWFEHAAMMCQVYRNAYLTICALGASDIEQGCFAERNSLHYEPCTLFKDGEDVSWYFEPRKFVFTQEWFRYQPLCQRGWTFQERMLSPRTLYFGEILIFECLQDMKPEFEVLMQSLIDDNLLMKRRILALNDAENAQAALTNLQDLWQRIVQVYTSANLTYREDRVAALNGIIDLVGQSTLAKYHVGFWQPLQPHMLLWEVAYDSNGGQSHALSNDRAPTWSWLAMDCSVMWREAHTTTLDNLCSILHVSKIETKIVQRATLFRGQIILRGSLCKILSIRDKYPDGILGGMNRSFGSLRLDVTVQGFEGPGARHAFIYADYWIEEQRNFDFVEINGSTARDGDDILEASQTDLPPARPLFHGRDIRKWQQLYFMPVNYSDPQCAGLILCPDPRDGLDEHFIRVGIMTFEGKEPYNILPMATTDVVLV